MIITKRVGVYLTENDCELFEKLKNRVECKAVVDNDVVWVEDKLDHEIVGYFDSYGEDFIIAMFEYMQMDAGHC